MTPLPVRQPPKPEPPFAVMPWRQVCIVVASLLAGFVLGRSLAPESASSRAPQNDHPPRVEASGSLVHAAGPSTPSIPVRPQPPSVPADTPARERLRLLQQIQEDGLVQFHGVPFLNSDDGRVTDGFVRLFGLTPSERSAFDAAVLHSREAMNRLVVENATAREDPATNGLVIEIKAFPESGGQVHDQFMASIRGVLGDDRYEALQKLIPSPAIEAQFGRFGASERRIEFSRAGRDAEGRMIYAWNDAHEAPWGESASGGQGTQAAILHQFGALATSLTPPVFWNEPRTP